MKKENDVRQQFLAARRSGVPLLQFITPDPAATVRWINEAVKDTKKGSPALFLWDCVGGVQAANPKAQPLITSVYGADAAVTTANLLETLKKTHAGITKGVIPDYSIIFVQNAHRFIREAPVSQAIWRLRDACKQRMITLVLLAPMSFFPPELANDVVNIVEPLPDEGDLTQIVENSFVGAGLPKPSAEELRRATDAVIGLPAFPAEQAVAMALTRDGVNQKVLWQRKKELVENTPGLTVWTGDENFAGIGGCTAAKQFLAKILNGKQAPRVIVYMDELEKALAGARSDTSGVTQAMLGMLLSFMQDENALGVIFIGPPGAAKSAMAKATGNEAKIMTVQFDIPGMKASLVGESESRMRYGLNMVSAVGQGKALFIATVNSIGDIPSPLLRRFNLAKFFFDLPDAQERAAIWDVYMKKYPDVPRGDGPIPSDNWTGAEIKTCVENAWRMDTTIVDAAQYITPVAVSNADEIAQLRAMANGRFLSASYPGNYQMHGADLETPGRRIELEG